MSVKVKAALAAGVTAVTAAATAGTIKILLSRRPAMPSDAAMYAPAVPSSDAEMNPGELRVTFMGVSTLTLTDGETTLIVDGFFSRPSAQHIVVGRISPNHAVIDECLRKGEISDADAILVAHSHYDHALDSAAVAWRTNATLVGSESTLNIGRGYGLRPEQMALINIDEPMKFGRFRVEAVLSEHSPHGKFQGLIEAPLTAPAKAKDYKMAECYSFLVSHTSPKGQVRTMLIHPSAGVIPNCLEGKRAEVAFLGVGTLGKQTDEFRTNYWHETIETVRARRVYPIHWDDFTLPLDVPLKPMAYLFDDFPVTLEFLDQRRTAEGVEVLIPEAFVRIDPFAEL